MVLRAVVKFVRFWVLWLCVTTALPHSTTFQKFDRYENQTYRKEVPLYLGMPVTETTAALCHSLFKGSSSDEVIHCRTMAAQTIRDHLSTMLVAVTRRPEFGHSHLWPQSAVVTLALSYAYDAMPAESEPQTDRVCLVGVPSPYDFAVIMLANNVDELWIFIDMENSHMLDRAWEQSMMRVAGELNKKVLVLRGAPRETLEQASALSGAGRPCDVLHIQDTGLGRGASKGNVHELVQAAAGVREEDSAPLQLVYVGDVDLTARTSSFPLVSIGGRQFAAHNMTDGLFAPPRLAGSWDSSSARWLLGSVWINESTLAATANWDGMTGRSYGTALRPSQPGPGAALPWMRQVWLGEFSGTGSSGSSSIANGEAASNPTVRVRGPEDVTVVLSYTIRVFGETALGLRAAIRSLGYDRVLIVPDVTPAALRQLEATAVGDGGRRQGCTGCLLQIALGPHDFTMLLERFIAFQMEQVWSTVAFGGDYKLRYGLVLSRAACILAYAPLHADLLHRLGYPCVFEVPLYSLGVAGGRSQVQGDGNPAPSTDPPPPLQDFVFFGGCSSRRRIWLEGLTRAFPLCERSPSPAAAAPARDEEGNNDLGQPRECWRYVLHCVGWENGVFDAMRESQVAQSALVLNVHTDGGSVLEVHRINSLLESGSCVVSERSADPVLDARYASAVRFVDAGDQQGMHDAVRRLLSNATALRHCRQEARTLHRSLSGDTENLGAAITAALQAVLS